VLVKQVDMSQSLGGVMKIKRFTIQLGLLALVAAVANATPLCTSDTWQNYINNFQAGCLVGDKLFSNFGISASNVPASNINVSPDIGVGFEGLFFSSGSYLAFANGTKDSTLTYTVSAPGQIISSSTLTMAGRITSGTGVITVTEDLQQGVVDIPGSPISVSAAGSGAATLDFVGAGGTLQTVLNVSTQIHVHANASSTATLSQITETFTQLAPEPLQSVMVGSGIILLSLVSRKRRNR
jgi:hypothetical protein